MQIKIIQCSDSLLWYKNYIGSIFEVEHVLQSECWVREPDGVFKCLNFVKQGDYEIYKE